MSPFTSLHGTGTGKKLCGETEKKVEKTDATGGNFGNN
jgi:hypothetical protein